MSFLGVPRSFIWIALLLFAGACSGDGSSENGLSGLTDDEVFCQGLIARDCENLHADRCALVTIRTIFSEFGCVSSPPMVPLQMCSAVSTCSDEVTTAVGSYNDVETYAVVEGCVSATPFDPIALDDLPSRVRAAANMGCGDAYALTDEDCREFSAIDCPMAEAGTLDHCQVVEGVSYDAANDCIDEQVRSDPACRINEPSLDVYIVLEDPEGRLWQFAPGAKLPSDGWTEYPLDLSPGTIQGLSRPECDD